MKRTAPVVIATAPTHPDALLVQSILENEGIPTFDKGDAWSLRHGARGFVHIAVAPLDVERAKEALARAGVDIEGAFAPDEVSFFKIRRFGRDLAVNKKSRIWVLLLTVILSGLALCYILWG
jgi:hypothetical protein